MTLAGHNSIEPRITLAHFSDIHITCRPLGWERADWMNKRLAAWLNLRLLGRGFRFRQADAIVEFLVQALQERRPDHLIFSGDATALGFESELVRAASLLGLANGDSLPGLAVPGNHDYCTVATASGGYFEHHFAPWQKGERVDGAIYPFAQRVGHAWLVAVNTSTANRWPWDASGAIDELQLERLTRLLQQLSPGPRILVTHYPVCLANGRLERRSHGLRNLKALVQAADTGGICLWLHGHRHRAYHQRVSPHAPFPVICSGSVTQTRRWSYYEYSLSGYQLQGTRWTFQGEKRAFASESTFTWDLHRE